MVCTNPLVSLLYPPARRLLLLLSSLPLLMQVTNDFSFVFCAVGCHPLRPVEPESLSEAVQYLAAHRWGWQQWWWWWWWL